VSRTTGVGKREEAGRAACRAERKDERESKRGRDDRRGKHAPRTRPATDAEDAPSDRRRGRAQRQTPRTRPATGAGSFIHSSRDLMYRLATAARPAGHCEAVETSPAGLESLKGVTRVESLEASPAGLESLKGVTRVESLEASPAGLES
jgi:hypothetical protein